MTIARPMLRWHGGKFILGKWIVANLPSHRIYVEPFCGACSVLLHKPRSYAEVVNDLHDDLVNFLAVIRDHSEVFYHKVYWTSFSRKEFELSYQSHPDPVERARRFAVRAWMGFGSNGASGTTWTGFRSNSSRSGSTPAADWKNWVHEINSFAERLRGVVIEHKDYRALIADHDGPETLFYFDPPYMLETRNTKHAYKHDWKLEEHEQFLESLKSIQGSWAVSGYAHPLYEEALKDCRRIERDTLADGAKKRTEILWIKTNPHWTVNG